MSDDFDDMLKTLPLTKPSVELDSKIANIIRRADSVSTDARSFNVKKFFSYAVAALLFIAVGITELMKRHYQSEETMVSEPLVQPQMNPVKANSTLKVSTSERSDKLVKGQVIKLDDTSFVRPFIRQKTVRKVYYDSATNTWMVIEQPENEVYYVPLEVN